MLVLPIAHHALVEGLAFAIPGLLIPAVLAVMVLRDRVREWRTGAGGKAR
ncbi:hypothetical protein [Thermoleophilum album]|uniref:Uncharacterized protein n=1 Tax=Thermoleophilum album TaxID=29539 RepID=A0A1H6FIA9_THEAL|nr:hypothetical protein [Thermoleophilum album]SEH10579.1 hypothetical protein SAMN02745716_0447 [Thermoleophilum album]